MWTIKLEAIKPINVNLTLTNVEIYQCISALNNYALDERILGNNEQARKIIKIAMNLEDQIKGYPVKVNNDILDLNKR